MKRDSGVALVSVALGSALAVSACGGHENTTTPTTSGSPPPAVSTGQSLYSFSGGRSTSGRVDAYGNAAIKRARPYAVPTPAQKAPGQRRAAGIAQKGAAPAAAGPVPQRLASAAKADAGYWPGPFRSSVSVLEGIIQFDEARQTYVCSGTLMNSAKGSVVWTAGHCVHEGAPARGKGKYHTNWLFAPGFRNGKAPYGWWRATELDSVYGWTLHGNLRYDLGAAILERKHGRTAGQVIADGEGIEWGYHADQSYTSFGYPQEYPYNGKRLAFCRSELLRRKYPAVRVYRGKLYAAAAPVTGPPTMEIRCNMTPGSSGGGWFARFDGIHWGYVNGVNSTTGGRTMDSPYFGSAAHQLWNYVKGS